MRWRTAFDEQVGQCGQHVFVAQLTCHDQCQALATGLVDDGQDAELAPIVGTLLDEIIGPDMPRILWSKPDAGAVIEPQPAAFRLALRHFQPLTPSDPLDPLVV